MEEDYDNQTVTLKNPIDINDLRNNQEKGVVFELEEEEAPPDFETCNNYFDGEAAAENLYHPDESDSDDEDDDLTPFERMAKKMEDICPFKDGGVMKKILKQGSGPVVPVDSVVRVHYSGFQEYADEPFDSTRLQNTVKKFRVGQGEVIEGFDLAVSTMKKGELARFLISPQYGFHDCGAPPRIPAEATVMFEIELLSFVEHAGLDDYFIMTREEREQVSFNDIKKIYFAINKEAKELYQANQLRNAFAKYKRAMSLLEDHNLKNEEIEKKRSTTLEPSLEKTNNVVSEQAMSLLEDHHLKNEEEEKEQQHLLLKAMSLLEDHHLKNEEEEKEQQHLLLKVCLNTAVCCVKLCHSGRAIVYCKKALEIDPKNVKALYSYGKALHQLSEFGRARDFLIRAQRIKPQDKDINTELEKLNKDMKNFKLVEKNMYSKMLSNPQGGQSKEEKNAEEQRRTDQQEKCEKCTPEFEKMVKEKLTEFKQDKDIVEFPLPSYNLTQGEIACLISTSKDLGLECKVRGSGQHAQLKIFKMKPT